MSEKFLGIGWKFPVQLTEDGAIATSEYEQDIRESILIILGTAIGERVMRPTFGAGIQDHVFDTIDSVTTNLITYDVSEALINWEPRIDVVKVNVSTAEASRGKLSIFVDYRVRATNTIFNLVYPFYLNGSEV